VTTTVTPRPDAHRYEVSVSGEPAGFTEYKPAGRLVAFLHTEVDPALSGRGLASTLIGHALDDVRAQGKGALPYCPFVRGFIAKHPEYLDLVPEDRRAQFELEEIQQ
jgi:predicted GNAT family acetyltransferase